MGLATIDSHSHKVKAKLYKILKFGAKRSNHRKQETAIWKCQNLQRNVHDHSDAIRTQRPDGHTFLSVNFDVFKQLYLSQN